MKKTTMVFNRKIFAVCFFTCLLIISIPERSVAQSAPGWSRGQQSLPIGYDECVNRAYRALEAEGYRIDNAAGGSFAVGIKGFHTAVIMCTPGADGKTTVNIVVASNGDGGGTERQRLQARMEQQSIGNNSTCGLGAYWDETEEGWTSVWSRRGTTNVFDVRMAKGSAAMTAVHTINITGGKVYVTRTEASDGNNCEMEGAIAPDGVTVTGTYRCKSGGPYNWNAMIRCTANVKCGLGVSWNETEEGWNAVWTRRGNSNVFDVNSSKSGTNLTAVQTIEINGNQVTIRRSFSSDGNTCDMKGTISADGVTVTGTYYCKNGGPYNWSAKINCQ